MQLLSNEITSYIEKSSSIRKMFENGLKMKAKYGAENVFDFSLGNPDLPPPAGVIDSLDKLKEEFKKPYSLGYMPNAGYPQAKENLAAHLSKEQGKVIKESNVILTCGAAGAINTFFRAVLQQEDEIICPAPYFAEYFFYASNYKVKFTTVNSKPMTFELDLAAIDKAITPKTRIFLMNSPNNPTGAIYSKKEISELAKILKKHSNKNGKPIFLLSDEPYRFLNYDNVEIASVFSEYEYSVLAGSFSKSLSLAGERIGYLAINPDIPESEELMSGLVLCTRALGYVNAPAIGQRLLNNCLGHEVDIEIYKKRRDLMAEILTDNNIKFTIPKGAFYFFPQSPLENEAEYIDMLMAEKILAVQGSAFGYPGYFRLAFCTNIETIQRSAEAFKRVTKQL